MEDVIVPDVTFEDLKFEQEIGAGGLNKQILSLSIKILELCSEESGKSWKVKICFVNKYCSCYQTNNGYAKWVSE